MTSRRVLAEPWLMRAVAVFVGAAQRGSHGDRIFKNAPPPPPTLPSEIFQETNSKLAVLSMLLF